MNQIFYVILGLTLIIGTNFLVTLAMIYFYLAVAKVEESVSYKLKLTGWLSLANIAVQLLGLIVFSSGGVNLYAISVFLMSIVGYLLVLVFGYKYHMLENAILAGTLAIILNPFWLHIFGVGL